MKRRVKLFEALGFAGISSIGSFLLFLMVAVFFAQIITDFLILESSGYGLLIIIIVAGFFTALLISIIISLLVTKTIPYPYIWSATVLAFILNLVIWFIISYVGLWIVYPNTVNGLYVWEVIIIIPEIIATFGIYIIKPDVTWLWLYSVLSYTLIYGIFLYWLGSPYEDKKQKLTKRMFKYDG